MITSAQIADALKASLNGASFSQPFTAERVWLVKFTLVQLAELKVSVVPGQVTWQPMDRRRDDVRHAIDIAVQKRVDPSNNAQVDPLAALVQQIAHHCRALQLTAGAGKVTCVERSTIPGAEAMVAKEHLEDLRAFLGVLRTVWVTHQ